MGLKDILMPNHKHDDDVMYGDGAKTTDPSTSNHNPDHATSSSMNAGTPQNTSSTSTTNNATDQTGFQDPYAHSSSKSASMINTTAQPLTDDDAATVSSIKSGVLGDRPVNDNVEQLYGSSSSHATAPTNAGHNNTSASRPTQTDDIGSATYTARTFHLPTSNDHSHGGAGHAFNGDPCRTEHAPPNDPPGYPRHNDGPHNVETANRVDPHVPGSYPTSTGDEHHSKTAAAGAVGTGSAGIAAEKAWRDQSTTSAQHHTSQTPSHGNKLLDKLDPRVKQESNSKDHHHGRDAAVIGSAAVAGAGVDRAVHSDERTAHNATNHGMANAQDTPQYPHTDTTGARSAGAQSLEDQRAVPTHHDQQGHGARNATAIGVGAIALGTSAHEATRQSHAGPTDSAESSQVHHNSSLLNKLDPRVKTSNDKLSKDSTPYQQSSTSQRPVDLGQQTVLPARQRQETTDDTHHTRNNPALVGSGGAVAAVGAGAYAHDKHADRELEKQLEQQQKSQNRVLQQQLKEHDKELKHDLKDAEKARYQAVRDHEKELYEREVAALQLEASHQKQIEEDHKHQQREHEKAVAAVEKQHAKDDKHERNEHDKALAAAEKDHFKEAQREHKQELKQQEKDEKHQQKVLEHMEKVDRKHAERETKPGLLDRILHKDKSHSEDDHAGTMPSTDRDTASASGTVTADTIYGNDGKLHKEPPRDVKDKLAGTGFTTTGFGRDATIEGADSTDPTTGLEGTRAPVNARNP